MSETITGNLTVTGNTTINGTLSNPYFDDLIGNKLFVDDYYNGTDTYYDAAFANCIAAATSHDEIVFPKNDIRISDTILINKALKLSFQGKSITQVTNTKNIFTINTGSATFLMMDGFCNLIIQGTATSSSGKHIEFIGTSGTYTNINYLDFGHIRATGGSWGIYNASYASAWMSNIHDIEVVNSYYGHTYWHPIAPIPTTLTLERLYCNTPIVKTTWVFDIYNTYTVYAKHLGFDSVGYVLRSNAIISKFEQLQGENIDISGLTSGTYLIQIEPFHGDIAIINGLLMSFLSGDKSSMSGSNWGIIDCAYPSQMTNVEFRTSDDNRLILPSSMYTILLKNGSDYNRTSYLQNINNFGSQIKGWYGILANVGDVKCDQVNIPVTIWNGVNKKEIELCSATPSHGSWAKGEDLLFDYTNSVFKYPSKSGTFDTLNSGLTTGTISSGTNILTVNNNTGLIPLESFITINGAGVGGTNLETLVISVYGTEVLLANNAPTSVTNASISYTVPTFSTMPVFSDINYTNLNANGSVGTGATQVAAGNHTHSGVYEPANANIQSHISNTSNPHNVTKTQIGLENVPNIDTTILEARHYIGTTGEPVFQNSWVNYGGTERQLSYWKDNFGIVHIEGSIKSGTLGATVFTLPTGYRPAENIYFTIVGPSSSLAIASVNNNGTFIVNGSNNSVIAIQLAFRP